MARGSLRVAPGSASVVPLEAQQQEIVSGRDVARSPPMSAGATLNWDTSITVVSDEEVRSRLTATSGRSKQERQPGFLSATELVKEQ